jgi:hypothetical protein
MDLQEVCKFRTLNTSNERIEKKLSFSFSPFGARVSTVVEETPGRFENEVTLYKEAPG